MEVSPKFGILLVIFVFIILTIKNVIDLVKKKEKHSKEFYINFSFIIISILAIIYTIVKFVF